MTERATLSLLSICTSTLCLPPMLLRKILNCMFNGQDFLKVIILLPHQEQQIKWLFSLNCSCAELGIHLGLPSYFVPRGLILPISVWTPLVQYQLSEPHKICFWITMNRVLPNSLPEMFLVMQRTQISIKINRCSLNDTIRKIKN